jgi:hypothetical protein
MDETLSSWSQKTDGRCMGGRAVYVGSCGRGQSFVLGVAPFEVEVRFFDSQRRFVAQAIRGDAMSAPCGGQEYWPRLVACDSPTIDQVECPAPGDVVPGDRVPPRFLVDPSKIVLPGSGLDRKTGLPRK